MCAVVTVGQTCALPICTVFYNAMLPDIAARARIGRISGWGWGLGYLGGLACMILSLVGFVQTDDPWFGVGTEDARSAERRVGKECVSTWRSRCSPQQSKTNTSTNINTHRKQNKN